MYFFVYVYALCAWWVCSVWERCSECRAGWANNFLWLIRCSLVGVCDSSTPPSFSPIPFLPYPQFTPLHLHVWSIGRVSVEAPSRLSLLCTFVDELLIVSVKNTRNCFRLALRNQKDKSQHDCVPYMRALHWNLSYTSHRHHHSVIVSYVWAPLEYNVYPFAYYYFFASSLNLKLTLRIGSIEQKDVQSSQLLAFFKRQPQSQD